MLVDVDFIKPEELTVDMFKDNLSTLPDFLIKNFGIEEIQRLYRTNIFPEKIHTGIYDAWNMDVKYYELYCRSHDIDMEMATGVCDDYEQILLKYPYVTNDTDEIVINICNINKDIKVNGNHLKWSDLPEYIGNYIKTTEYINEEISFTNLNLYSILKLKRKCK